MRVIVAMAGLALVATAAQAQLAVQRPTEKIAVLPLAAGPADSVASIQVMDAARSRLEGLAKYKVFVLPKNKYCEVLESSGYKCDDLLDSDESRTLARTLGMDSYTQGRLERRGSQLVASVRVIDIGGSGFARAFTVDNASSPQALGDAIAQRLNQVIRAGEGARECNDQRSKGQLQRAVQSAKKALQSDPDLTGAHLCLILTYEALKMPPDSLIAVANRALKGDPQNNTALSTLASAYLQKNDTAQAMEARYRQWSGDRKNKPILLGLIQLARMRKQVPQAVALVDSGLTAFPDDEQLSDMRITLCIEGELPCAVDALASQARRDTTRLRDTAFAKVAIANAQKHQRPEECRLFAAGATAATPSSATFWKARGACYEMATMLDSALWAYRRAADLDRTDLSGSLLVAKTIIESAQYDTARAKAFGRDSAGLAAYRRAFAARLDTARTYLQPAIKSSDTTMQLNAAAMMRTAGEKLVRAGAIEPAYEWLDQTLQVVGPRRAGESGSGGLRDAVRVNTSFWYGLASIPALPGMYQSLAKRKDSGRCDDAKVFNDRVNRTREALQIGRSVHEPTVQRYLETIKKFEPAIASVRTAFKCKNF